MRCSVIFERNAVVARGNVSLAPARPISTVSGRTTTRMLRNQNAPTNTAMVSPIATTSTTLPRVEMFMVRGRNCGRMNSAATDSTAASTSAPTKMRSGWRPKTCSPGPT